MSANPIETSFLLSCYNTNCITNNPIYKTCNSFTCYLLFRNPFSFFFFFFFDPYIFSVFLFNTAPLQGGFVQAYRAVRRVYHVSWAALPPGKRAQAAVPRKSAERRHRKALGMLTHSFRIKSSWTYRTANLKFNDHSLRDSWIILRI